MPGRRRPTRPDVVSSATNLRNAFGGALGGALASPSPISGRIDNSTVGLSTSIAILYQHDVFPVTASGSMGLSLTYIPIVESEHVYLLRAGGVGNGMHQRQSLRWIRLPNSRTLTLYASAGAQVGDTVIVEYAYYANQAASGCQKASTLRGWHGISTNPTTGLLWSAEVRVGPVKDSPDISEWLPGYQFPAAPDNGASVLEVGAALCESNWWIAYIEDYAYMSITGPASILNFTNLGGNSYAPPAIWASDATRAATALTYQYLDIGQSLYLSAATGSFRSEGNGSEYATWYSVDYSEERTKLAAKIAERHAGGGYLAFVVDGSGSYDGNMSYTGNSASLMVAAVSAAAPLARQSLFRCSGYDQSNPSVVLDLDGTPIAVGGDGTEYGDGGGSIPSVLSASTQGAQTESFWVNAYNSVPTGNAGDGPETMLEGVRHAIGHAKSIGAGGPYSVLVFSDGHWVWPFLDNPTPDGY